MSNDIFHKTHVWPVDPIVTLLKQGIDGKIDWPPGFNFRATFPGAITNAVSVAVDLTTYKSYGGGAKFHIVIERWDGTNWKVAASDDPVVDTSDGKWHTQKRVYTISSDARLVPDDKNSYIEFQVTASMDVGGGYSDHPGSGQSPRPGPTQTTLYLATFTPPSLNLTKAYATLLDKFDAQTVMQAKRPRRVA